MAKQDISLNIGTKFNGEGFKKMNQAVQGAAGSVRSASKNINGVVQALGGVEGQVGKIFNGIGNIMGAFAGGGVFGLAVAGIGLAFKTVMDKIEEAKKKAEEAAKAMREAFEKMFEGLGERISRIRGGANERVEYGNYESGRLSKDITREQKAEIARIQSEGIDRRSKMTDEDEKAVDLAKEELEIQKLITKSIKEQNDLKVKNATNTYNARKSALGGNKQLFNSTMEKYNKDQAEIDKKIAEQQKKIEAAKKHNASSERFQTFTTTVGSYTVDTSIDTKPMEEEIKKLTQQKNELYDIKEKALSKIDLGKDEQEVKRALDALSDTVKDRNLAMKEAALGEKKAQQKLNDAIAKKAQAEQARDREQRDAARKFVEGYEQERKAELKKKEEEDRKKRDAERKEKINEQIAKEQEAGAKKQQDLNKQLEQAKKAVQDWVANFNNNRNVGFGEFNKAQNEAGKMVQLAVDTNGNPIEIDKKQANKVAANRRELDRLLKMRNPDARTRKEIERRQAFDDMFNPEKLKERMKKEDDARKAKEQADKTMRDNIAALKKMLVDDNGVAI